MLNELYERLWHKWSGIAIKYFRNYDLENYDLPMVKK